MGESVPLLGRGNWGSIKSRQRGSSKLTESDSVFTASSESYRMSDSSCARQRARSSIFIVSESLFPIRSHRKCTLSSFFDRRKLVVSPDAPPSFSQFLQEPSLSRDIFLWMNRGRVHKVGDAFLWLRRGAYTKNMLRCYVLRLDCGHM